jgi:peroxiredoxin family protein
MSGPSLSIVLHSGDYERAHYALAMASAAAAIGRTVTILFAGEGVASIVTAAGWLQLNDAPERDALFRQRGIAGFEELLGACRDLSIHLIVCETALRAAGLDATAIRPDLTLEVGGIVALLNAADGQLIFV